MPTNPSSDTRIFWKAPFWMYSSPVFISASCILLILFCWIFDTDFPCFCVDVAVPVLQREKFSWLILRPQERASALTIFSTCCEADSDKKSCYTAQTLRSYCPCNVSWRLALYTLILFHYCISLHLLLTSGFLFYSSSFTKWPHLAGTEPNLLLAKKIQGQWKEFGLDSAELVYYDVLLSYPDEKQPNYISVIDDQGNEVIFSMTKLYWCKTKKTLVTSC